MREPRQEIRAIQQGYARVRKRRRDLLQKQERYIEKETKKRSEQRDGFSGAFSTTSLSKYDPDHARHRHQSEGRINVMNEIIEEVAETDRYQELTQQLEANSSELDAIWADAEETLLNEDDTKKANIGRIWSAFGTDVSKRRVVEAVDCHHQYPARLQFDPESGGAEYKDRVKARRENRVRSDQREEIIERDGGECVRCGQENHEALRVHHIIPVSEGGAGDSSNLATLCEDCHRDAHNNSSEGSVVYDDTEGFQAWVRGSSRGLGSEQERLSDYDHSSN